MAGPPFEVVLHLGGGITIPFTITEESLATHRHPQIRSLGTLGTREGFRTGAVTIIEKILSNNDTKPVSVIDGRGAYWLIPIHAIFAIEFRDTTLEKSKGTVGFTLAPGASDTGEIETG